ncbi:MAG: hypothetical protein EOP06_13355 [Proteobacteria bacterium]|nr:MAG: hypothetical protein EOP06_13355 [Pseudomonadota bacterium]
MRALEPDYIFLSVSFADCSRAIRAMEEAIRLAEDDGEVLDGATVKPWLEIFDHIRLALHFSASVSRMLFPVGTKEAAEPAGKRRRKFSEQQLNSIRRGMRLREIVGVEDTHPIHDRELRNRVEHLDEYLDVWVGDLPRPYFVVEKNIDEDIPDGLRRDLEESCPIIYYSFSGDFVICGYRFNILNIKLGLVDIQERIGSAIIAFGQADKDPLPTQ